MRIAELNFCDLVVNFWRTLCFSMEVLLFMKFIFLVLFVSMGMCLDFGLLAMNFHITQLGFRYSPSIPSVCATCVVFTQLDSLTFLGLFIYFYLFLILFTVVRIDLIWIFEFNGLRLFVWFCRSRKMRH